MCVCVCVLLIVETCMKSLCHILPPGSGWSLLTSLYFTSSGLPFSKLLPHFSSWILSSLSHHTHDDSKGSGSATEHAQRFSCPEQLRPKMLLALHLVYEVNECFLYSSMNIIRRVYCTFKLSNQIAQFLVNIFHTHLLGGE